MAPHRLIFINCRGFRILLLPNWSGLVMLARPMLSSIYTGSPTDKVQTCLSDFQTVLHHQSTCLLVRCANNLLNSCKKYSIGSKAPKDLLLKDRREHQMVSSCSYDLEFFAPSCQAIAITYITCILWNIQTKPQNIYVAHHFRPKATANRTVCWLLTRIVAPNTGECTTH